MTYKQLETSREIRLWLGQIIVPAVAGAMMFPEVREKVKSSAQNIKSKIKNKIH